MKLFLLFAGCLFFITSTFAVDVTNVTELRNAITAANSASGTTTINIKAGTYTLASEIIVGNTNSQTINLVGDGATTTIIDGNNVDRIFIFNSTGTRTGLTINLSGVTLKNGKLTSDQFGGGAILAGGPTNTYSISNCIISNNTISSSLVPGSNGGALALTGGGAVTISNCTFTGNSNSKLTAGAIFFSLQTGESGSLSITNSTFSNNSAPIGGAINIATNQPMVCNITENTFTNNTASNMGGAIAVVNSFAGTTLNINYNRFYGNTAPAFSSAYSAVLISNGVGNVNVSNNWWGCNGGPTSCTDKAGAYIPGTGTNTFTPYLMLRTVPANASVCLNQSTGVTADFTINSNNGTVAASNLDVFTGLTMNFTAVSGNVSPTSATVANGAASTTFTGTTTAAPGTVTATIDNASVTSSNITINPGTTFSQQPATTTNVCPGFGTSIVAAATGTGTITYQWYKNSAILNNGGNISGATTGTLNIASASSSDVATYYVIATGTCGQLQSNNASLVLNTVAGFAANGQPASTSVCVGGSTSFTAIATGSPTPTYQWRKGTINLVNGVNANGTTFSNVTSATLGISTAAVADAGNDYNVLVTNSCRSTPSNNVTLTVNVPGTWLGSSNTLWSNTANWVCGALPTATTNVTIPSGTNFSPAIDITTAVVNNITINSGATLTFTGTTNILDIKGAATVNGTFNPSAGKVIFSGATQVLPALTYKDLQINGAGSKTLAGGITVNGVLTLTSGTVSLDANNITISSTGSVTGASSSSYIVTNGTGALVQQNIGTSGRTGGIVFPVGSSTLSYTPVTLSNIGVADAYTVRMLGSVSSSYNTSDVPTGTTQTSNAVGRAWLVSEGTAGGSAVSLTLQWNAADELTSFNRAASFISHYYIGFWHKGATSAAVGSNPYTQTISGVDAFSPFGIASAGSPLPLTLLTFTGSINNNGKQLVWSTSAEENFDSFVLERSENGTDFNSIATIVGKGNNAGTNNYSYTDATGSALIYYYRLKMVDKDGTITYSNIVSINNSLVSNNGYNIRITPNPFQSKVLVKVATLQDAQLTIELVDINGRKLSTQISTVNKGDNTINIDALDNLANGTYMLHLFNNNTNQTIKLIKNK